MLENNLYHSVCHLYPAACFMRTFLFNALAKEDDPISQGEKGGPGSDSPPRPCLPVNGGQDLTQGV